MRLICEGRTEVPENRHIWRTAPKICDLSVLQFFDFYFCTTAESIEHKIHAYGQSKSLLKTGLNDKTVVNLAVPELAREIN